MIGLLASRIQGLARALAGDGPKYAANHSSQARDGEGLDKLLLPVKGVGPMVVANYRALRGI